MFVLYDRQLTPIFAAKDFCERLRRAGKEVFDLGSGKEIDEPRTLISLVRERRIFQADYWQARKTAAGFVNRMLGIPAEAENTFVLGCNGRNALRAAFFYAAKNTTSRLVGLPEIYWPMFRDILSEAKAFHPVYFAHPERRTFNNDVKQMIGKRPYIVVTNTPHNPTGMIYEKEWMRKLGEDLDEVNGEKEEKTFHLIDITYFHAFKQKSEKEPGPYLNCWLDQITKENAATPWIVIMSFSKALAMPTPGLTVVVVNPSVSADFGGCLRHYKQLENSLREDKEFNSKIVSLLSEDMDQEHLRHYSLLREKYERNREILKNEFNEHLVEGDPCASALLRLENVFGRRAEEENHKLHNTADLVEYLGNQYGVVVVDNGETNGSALLRIMMTSNEDYFRKAIEQLGKGIRTIYPLLAPQRGTLGKDHNVFADDFRL